MASTGQAADNKKIGLGLSQTELRALEQTRLRLQALTLSLASFKNDLHHNQPLPNPQSIQTSATILKNHTTYLLDHLTKQSTLFQRLAVHPAPNYPGRTQEPVQTQLLRKKLDPQVEQLVEQARAQAAAAGISPAASFVSHERLVAAQAREKQALRQAKFGLGAADDSGDDTSDSGSSDDGGSGGGGGSDAEENGGRVNEPRGLGDVWVDCVAWSRGRLARFAAEEGESLYTAEERALGVENVRTGLKRSLEEEESESEEEEEDEEDDDDEDDDGDTAMGGVGVSAAALRAGAMGRTADKPEGDAKDWMMSVAGFGSRGVDMAAPGFGAPTGGMIQQR